MVPAYNFQMQSNILYALNKHNELVPTPHLTILDAAILSLSKSFFETGNKLFMSNKELGRLLLADPGTVQRSIDRLMAAGLLKKEKEYIGGKPRRYLLYQSDAVQRLYDLL
jgi:predicted transcriptional regulator